MAGGRLRWGRALTVCAVALLVGVLLAGCNKGGKGKAKPAKPAKGGKGKKKHK